MALFNAPTQSQSPRSGIAAAGKVRALGLALCLVFLVAGPLAAETWPQDPGISVIRSFEASDAPGPLTDRYFATWIFSVEGPVALSGLYASEQYPSWLELIDVHARLDGQTVTVEHETGDAGEVLSGLVPHRFVFDDPEDGQPSLILQSGHELVLEYTLHSSVSGQAETRYNGWNALYTDGGEGALGGWLDDEPLLLFLRDESPLMLDDLSVVSALDHLEILWSLSLEGESESFRLQRGTNADPGQSLPLNGQVMAGPGDYRYDDYDVEPGIDYWYWIAILDGADQPLYYLGPGTGSLAAPALAGRLLPNFPNPFNPRTTLRFILEEAQTVELALFAPDGRRVRILAAGHLPAGSHDFVWDGRDDAGRDMASGNYFARLLTPANPAQIRKLTLIR